MAWYLDTSALVKLVVAEPETEALATWLEVTAGDWVSADLARTELLRAVRRGAPDRLVQAREVLDSITLLEVMAQVFEEAARVDPVGLRTLDSLHLAAALQLGDDLDGIVTYDDRLAEAAGGNAVRTVAPR